jgi:hypothetical protein
VRTALLAIKAGLLHQSVPPTEPGICQVVPVAVDRDAVPDHVKQLEFYGYDFDKAAGLAVFLEKTGGSREDVTTRLDRPTHYAMTLKFGENGVVLDDRSERFVLEWSGQRISTIAVIQPATPVCESRLQKIPPTQVTYMPPHTRGDADFFGHGPKVNATVTLVVLPDKLRASVYMKAEETTGDFTTAEGTGTFDLWMPDPKWQIDRVVGSLSQSHQYTDSNHSVDSFSFGGGLVSRMDFVGDTDGDEAGSRTKADIFFNEITVELTQKTGCVPANALQKIKESKLISGGALKRLEPQVLRQRQLLLQGAPR